MTLEMANRLVALRRDHGMSQEELADRLNISRQAVSKWERAEASPDLDNLTALARIYGVTLDELVHGITPEALESQVSNEDVDESESDAIDPDNPLPKGSFFDHLEKQRRMKYPYPVLVSLVYLVLGFFFNLWHPGWIIFLTIPLYYLPASQRKWQQLLFNPVMVTIVYLLLGFYCNLWHPGWMIFLAVPLLNGVVKDK